MTFEEARAALVAVVQTSSTRKDIGTASSNCASILVQAGMSLHGVQWNDVCLKDAVLSGAVLTSSSLQRADLRGAHLERIDAESADLRDAKLTGVSLGQDPMMLGHTDAVLGLVLSSDSTMLASCSADNSVRLWNAATGKLEATLMHSAVVIALAFFPGGTALISSCSDRQLRLWSWNDRPLTAATCATIHLGNDENDVATSLAVSPDNKNIAAGFANGDLRMFTAEEPGKFKLAFEKPAGYASP